MLRKKQEQHYKVAGIPKNAKLTPSKKISGGLSPLVHGKGVKAQAVLIPVDSGGRKRSIAGSLLAFATKILLAVLAVGVAISVAAVLLSAVADGVTAGLSDLADTISAGSTELMLIASVAVLLVVVGAAVKIARSVPRRRSRAAKGPDVSHNGSAEVRQYHQHFSSTYVTHVSQPAAPHHAQVAAAPAAWCIDPRNAAQLRYWNGAAWTQHVRPRQTASSTPAGWYPDPSNAAQLRYWGGTSWTHHLAPRRGAHVAGRPTTTSSDTRNASIGDEARLTMSSAEWQAHVRAWMAAGAVEQELWRRLSNARISDGDQLTLDAQRRMEQLTAEQGIQRVKQMLEANPGLRDELGLNEFLTHFLANLGSLERETTSRTFPPGRRLRS